MTSISFVTRREAIEIVAAAKFAGVPDRPAVTDVRHKGVEVADGKATDEAVEELWKAVDRNQLEVHLHGPGDRWLKMSAGETSQVPLLRAARGGDFTFLRPGNPFYERVVSEFGLRLDSVQLVFQKDQVEKIARLVRRRRRHLSAASGRRVGRPSRRDQVCSTISQAIEDGKWNTAVSLKTLVQIVQRSLKWEKGLSEATIARALDCLFEKDRDRRFCRGRRKPNNART